MTPEAVMAQHARSFAPATRLLPRSDRLRIARLYALCRSIDDIADEIGGQIGRDRLLNLHDDLYRPTPRDHLSIEARDLFNGCPLGLDAFAILVMTTAEDTAETCLPDCATLDAYCMGVAGTVGVMICTLFDVDTAHHARAADLGKAMQLSNICRDVAEDARIGRRYLPFALCPHGPEDIIAGDPAALRAAEAAMAKLLDRADGLYRSGHSGLAALPWRLRLAVAAAAAMYAGIGSELRRRHFQPLAGRAVVPVARKAALAVDAVRREILQTRSSKNRQKHART
jgi:phytoene synthase